MNSIIIQSLISSLSSKIKFNNRRIFSSDTASSNPASKKPIIFNLPPPSNVAPQVSQRKSSRFLKYGLIGALTSTVVCLSYAYASDEEVDEKTKELRESVNYTAENDASAFDLLDKAKNFVAEKVANMKKPEASLDDVDFKAVHRDSVDYDAKLAVKNPYGHPLPICEISYTLKSAGRVIASGTMPDPGSIKANDITMLNVPVKVPHSILVSLARDIGADWDIDYELELGLTIDLPIIGDFTIPLSRKGEIKLPTLSDAF